MRKEYMCRTCHHAGEARCGFERAEREATQERVSVPMPAGHQFLQHRRTVTHGDGRVQSLLNEADAL